MADDISLTHRNNFLKAQEKLKEAEAALRDALSNLSDATDYAIRTELRLIETPIEAVKFLSRTASANGSTWSGGPHNAINVIEHIKQERAVAALARLNF